MKYKDLPNDTLIQKLLQTSFGTPEKDLLVFNYCDSVLKHVRFLESQRIKLIEKYGKEKEHSMFVDPADSKNYSKFIEDFNNILGMDIQDSALCSCPIRKEWLDNETCSYSKDKNFWLTPKDIGRILTIANLHN